MEERIRVVVTQNTPINPSDGHFEIEYPNAFVGARNRRLNVVSCRVFNTITSQEDISFTIHGDFAKETDNRYDGFISFANSYFNPVGYIIRNTPQFFHIWFKVLGTDVVNFYNYSFVLTIELFYEK